MTSRATSLNMCNGGEDVFYYPANIGTLIFAEYSLRTEYSTVGHKVQATFFSFRGGAFTTMSSPYLDEVRAKMSFTAIVVILLPLFAGSAMLPFGDRPLESTSYNPQHTTTAGG